MRIEDLGVSATGIWASNSRAASPDPSANRFAVLAQLVEDPPENEEGQTANAEAAEDQAEELGDSRKRPWPGPTPGGHVQPSNRQRLDAERTPSLDPQNGSAPTATTPWLRSAANFTFTPANLDTSRIPATPSPRSRATGGQAARASRARRSHDRTTTRPTPTPAATSNAQTSTAPLTIPAVPLDATREADSGDVPMDIDPPTRTAEPKGKERQRGCGGSDENCRCSICSRPSIAPAHATGEIDVFMST